MQETLKTNCAAKENPCQMEKGELVSLAHKEKDMSLVRRQTVF